MKTFNRGSRLVVACVLALGCPADDSPPASDDGGGSTSTGAMSTGATPGSSSETGPADVSSSTTDPAAGTTAGDSDDTAGDSTTGGMPPAATVLHTITYAPGPAWDPKLPPREQDLAGHFAYVQDLFDDGVLLANGPFLDDGRGFYLHLSEQVADIDTIIEEDPAVVAGVLALEELGGWTLLLSQMGVDVGDDAFFVLNYTPGPQWERGTPLDQQPGIDEHLGYVVDAFEGGELLAGGPVDEASGRYIVALPDADAADAWAAADPTVVDGLFEVEIKPWLPLQRQSVAAALR